MQISMNASLIFHNTPLSLTLSLTKARDSVSDISDK